MENVGQNLKLSNSTAKVELWCTYHLPLVFFAQLVLMDVFGARETSLPIFHMRTLSSRRR